MPEDAAVRDENDDDVKDIPPGVSIEGDDLKGDGMDEEQAKEVLGQGDDDIPIEVSTEGDPADEAGESVDIDDAFEKVQLADDDSSGDEEEGGEPLEDQPFGGDALAEDAAKAEAALDALAEDEKQAEAPEDPVDSRYETLTLTLPRIDEDGELVGTFNEEELHQVRIDALGFLNQQIKPRLDAANKAKDRLRDEVETELKRKLEEVERLKQRLRYLQPSQKKS